MPLDREDLDGESVDPQDGLTSYIRRIQEFPFLGRSQELRAATATQAGTYLKERRDNLSRRRHVWEEVYVQLFRAWEDVQTYCRMYTVPPPDLFNLLMEGATLSINLTQQRAMYLEQYLDPLGWGVNDEETDRDATIPERSIEKLSDPLFRIVECAFLLPSDLQKHLCAFVQEQKKFPDQKEIEPFMKRWMTEDLSQHERLIREYVLQARSLLVLSNTRFAVDCAKKAGGSGVPIDDRVQDANIGLLEGVRRFQPHRGYRFKTGATWSIFSALRTGRNQQARTIRPAKEVEEKLFKFYEAKNALCESLGRDPTVAEIAEQMNQKVSMVVRIQHLATQNIQSLDASVRSSDPESGSLADRLVYSMPDPEERAFQLALQEILETVLEILPEREREFVILRHGLEGGPPYDNRQIGEIFGLTKERVRQLLIGGESRIIRQIACRFPHILPPGMTPEMAIKWADTREAKLPEKAKKNHIADPEA